MSNDLRRQRILHLLEENGAVSVRSLTEELFVSEATVRRDLTELERAGALKRTFGGAQALEGTPRQVPLFIRESMNSAAKSEICRQAASLLRDGCTVFIDGSSTAQYLVRYLAAHRDILVVTYSIKTAELMCKSHIRTYCTGGLLIENSLVCTGQEAVRFAETVNPDVCFFSCKGLSLDGKLTDTSEEETAVRRAFLRNSRTRVALMTGNKFGTSYFHTVCRTSDVDYLFSDAPLPEGILLRRFS
ncbi:MAG: DeoR/GlpR transcriptional regulator [Clostridia bacterium]|nr:DeoR/GlpR transcriptional regulator [Clostridia bacterium]